MLAGYPPFYDENPFGIYEKILLRKLSFPSYFDSASRDIIKKLLAKDRTKRLGNLRDGATDVKKHKFFRGIDWDALANKQVKAPLVPDTDHEGDSINFEEYDEPDEDPWPVSDIEDPFAAFFVDF
eukprot:TRINITY_DN124955_c1_g2_i1.p1 TRINITY_DN124955_c1_g2~~TRINITY_DN124955_c1_g2_i1.p1  ORF type:complete len:134 (-),score=34.94 TRINITY_DN124955_c1_g2_i1:45-419(-)